MPLILPIAPDQGMTLVRQNIGLLLVDERADDILLEVARPHPQYTATLLDVLDRLPLRRARRTSWHYLILRNEQSRGVAEVAIRRRPGGEEEDLVYAAFFEGGPTATVIDAIAVAEAFSNERDLAFELRILRIPALYLQAVWIHREEGPVQEDFLIPVAPAPRRVTANRVYTEAELLPVLHANAVETMQSGI